MEENACSHPKGVGGPTHKLCPITLFVKMEHFGRNIAYRSRDLVRRDQFSRSITRFIDGKWCCGSIATAKTYKSANDTVHRFDKAEFSFLSGTEESLRSMLTILLCAKFDIHIRNIFRFHPKYFGPFQSIVLGGDDAYIV